MAATAELFLAQFASILLLASVQLLVSYNVCLAMATVLAAGPITSKCFLRLVNRLMASQVGLLHKPHRTTWMIADEYFIVNVNPSVVIQIALIRERRLTTGPVTGKGAFSGVRSHMGDNIIFLCKKFAASWPRTWIRFLACMRSHVPRK